ncbi:hypothetical protein Lnau_1593 [Legionella nautarum]|uniref:Uncharacterized protein n=1 Tax=Legionella nautarum TaxID=45070 RepID=A0A0W0WWF1_9GAMM|nr:hypothetical protein [Legionella nautarum]KTD36609.1 hypothetical protein Lnau_1593 [Legionella nautarum]
MSIFSDVTKFMLIKHIKGELKRADSWNESWFWSSVSRRDVEHSKAKNEHVKTLCTKIMELEDQRNDRDTSNEFRNQINNCKDTTKELCVETGHNVGQLNGELTNALSLLERIHHVFEKNEHIYNIQPELNPVAPSTYDIELKSPSTRYSDPLDIILYYTALYYVKKYQQQEAQGWFAAKVESVLPGTVKVREEKKDLLHSTIVALKKALESTDHDKARYRENRKEIAIMCLSSILGENARVCESNTLHSNFSLPGMGWAGWFGKFSLQWSCAPGELKEAMRSALREITAMEIPAAKEILAAQKGKGQVPPPKEEGEKEKEVEEEAANDDSDEELEDDKLRKPKGHKKSFSLGDGDAMFAKSKRKAEEKEGKENTSGFNIVT